MRTGREGGGGGTGRGGKGKSLLPLLQATSYPPTAFLPWKCVAGVCSLSFSLTFSSPSFLPFISLSPVFFTDG